MIAKLLNALNKKSIVTKRAGGESPADLFKRDQGECYLLHPEWVSKHHPRALWSWDPPTMILHNPEWVAEVYPELLWKSSNELMYSIRPFWVKAHASGFTLRELELEGSTESFETKAIERPRKLFEIHPEKLFELRPLWLLEYKPEWLFFNKETFLKENRPLEFRKIRRNLTPNKIESDTPIPLRSNWDISKLRDNDLKEICLKYKREQIMELVRQDPLRFFNVNREWCLEYISIDNFIKEPEILKVYCERRPEKVPKSKDYTKYNLGYYIKYRPHAMAEIWPDLMTLRAADWMCANCPKTVFDRRAILLIDRNPRWLCECRPEWTALHAPYLLERFRPYISQERGLS